MNATELRAQSDVELRSSLEELLKEQFNLRMQQGSGQDVKPSAIRIVRKNIARINTVITEKKAGKAS